MNKLLNEMKNKIELYKINIKYSITNSKNSFIVKYIKYKI